MLQKLNAFFLEKKSGIFSKQFLKSGGIYEEMYPNISWDQ